MKNEDTAQVNKVMIYPDFNEERHMKDMAILKLDKNMGLKLSLNLHFEDQLTFPWIDPSYDQHSQLECFTIALEKKVYTAETKVNFVPIKTHLLDKNICLNCLPNDDDKWWTDWHNKCATINVFESLIKVRILIKHTRYHALIVTF